MTHFSTLVGGCLLAVYCMNVMATFDCYDYDSEKGGIPAVISGCQACVNVTLPKSGVAPYHTRFTQGCSPDVEKTLGCRPVDEDGTMCTCNSDKCNGDGKPYPPTDAKAQIRAFRLRSNISA